MTRERIEDFREIVLPFVKKRLLETNYENLGESDAEMFAKDFDEILNLAIKALEQEPKTGEWIEQNDDYFDWYECSECGYGSEGEMQYSSEYDVRTNYCPNCGAKMVEPQESEDKV